LAGYTAIHSQYLSHQITLEGLGEDAFAKSLTAARVDMNPHQVEAALFALKSPLAKGVLLADEVGLGKTIEASLVMAQRWAEHKRRILLIVPASLRKQWEQELSQKFSLPSSILEAKTYRDLVKGGMPKPFYDAKGVIITSYEFAARKAEEIALVPWDLVIFDEAHRLRNVYRKGGSKRAKELRAALKSPFKILLTATPLQNSLMELYGLVSVIDETHFGGEAAFKAMYLGARTNAASMLTLKQRLLPICHRTLRRQVQESGHFNYTARNAMTFDFEPADLEAKLYNDVSAFLQRKNTISYGDRTNHLVILQVRKILGSSTFAVGQYLEQLIKRLEAKKVVDISVTDDIDVMDELAEEAEADEEDEELEQIDPRVFEAEIEELKGYLELARRIGANAKGEKLIQRLPEALDQIIAKGGQRKAVIFTESVRTQKYLAELLSQNGYAGEIVLMNGSNSDPESRALYNEWKARHEGTDKLSGSRTADMKAAIVDAFRSDEKSILIATESGAEGINLQFCSLLVNFDLPWNPQRVEQRIGRCHRYGQKIDVTVVNMLNRKNQAEERIYQLLDKKFRLFSGVFGSSDEILGSIEKGVDFERKVLEIVQSARNEEQVQLEFDMLTEQIQDNIDADMEAARTKLLEQMDQDVVARLKTRKGSVDFVLNDFMRRLIMIAHAELPEAHFHEPDSPRFDYRGKTYTTEWPVADSNDWQFFRLSDGNLATEIVDACKGRPASTRPVALEFIPSAYPFAGQLVDVNNLRGKSGWLKVAKARIDTPNAPRESMILSCISDDGIAVSQETADRLLQVPSTTPKDVNSAPDAARLTQLEAELFKSFAEVVAIQNAEWLEQEEERLDMYAQDLETDIDAQIKQIEDEVKELKKQRRATVTSMEDKIGIGRQIKRKESERDDLVLSKHERRRQIRQQVENMLDDVAESLNKKPKLTELFMVRWSIAKE
jgi:superfamily II DNA or RNA helicase